MIFWRPPCETSAPLERLSPLVDGSDQRLERHVASCARCTEALQGLREQRALLAGLGDPPGAMPADAGFHGVMAVLRAERPQRRRLALVGALGVAALVAVGGVGVRQLLVVRARAVEDGAIVDGADAAFRRAEREYTQAIGLLRLRLRAEDPGGEDARVVEEGARVLADAREKAAELVSARRADPEREALLRTALRAEVRYYEDAILRHEGKQP